MNHSPEATANESPGTSRPSSGHEMAASECRWGRYLAILGSRRAACSTQPPIEKATKLSRCSASWRRELVMKPSTSAASRSAIVSIVVLTRC